MDDDELIASVIDCEIDHEETVIMYEGNVFYRSCQELVFNNPHGRATFCVKRLYHLGSMHEDDQGHSRDEMDNLVLW